MTMRTNWLVAALAVALVATHAHAQAAVPLAEAIASSRDLWGEAALRQPDGPSYEFFAPLLPPLRYVDAPFLHYPITLSAPAGPVKGRLVSNGSAVNALARQPNWRAEAGTPVTFRVGQAREVFGEDLRRLEGPKYERGYLPVVQLRYQSGGATYAQEAFAAVDETFAARGAVLVRFALAESKDDKAGKVEAQIEGPAPLAGRGGAVRDARGKVLACYDGAWTFNPARNTLTALPAPGKSASLLVFTAPADEPVALAGDAYDAQKRKAEAAWEELLGRGTQIEVPEPVVNNAWRSLIVGNFALMAGDEMRYSAGNQYAKLYVGEGGDAVRALALYGQLDAARRAIVPILDYTRKGLEFHQAGFKLQMLAHCYALTRDADFVRERRPRWQKEIDVITGGREEDSGLLPREKYCGDIDTRVYSLNSNANTWRGLRDMSLVLADLGGDDRQQAEALAKTAAEFRARILAAAGKSVRRDVTPPFVPVAMSGEEEPYDPIVGSRMGSYWNIMSCYVLGSGVFARDSEPATALLRYSEHHGGRFIGMNRARPEPTWWVSTDNVNDLYGMRYSLALLERDEPDLALVGFYGKLAHGLTRDTFIGGEGSCLRPLNEFGRQMYLPPNSAGNASFLQQLRYLLVQDLDLEGDDGRPDTLRLLFATPRRWLRDGAEIRVDRAPTAFGEVSLRVRSELEQGRVTAQINLPERPRAKTLLRLRVPAGWRVSAATAGGRAFPQASPETFDLSALAGRADIVAAVERLPK